MSQKSILHIDGDAFFASCEQAADPRLKGKPVVTGYERGMAVAVSYEAKALGIKRGDPVFKIRKEHPECVVSASHYELYERFSKRMLEVVRRHTPTIEEYSIDECFADLSDSYLGYKMTSKEIAQKIKKEIESELGMTFSLGVGPTKSLAKIASTKNKPSGFVYVSQANHADILKEVSIGDVWGIGRATSISLQTHGVRTAYDFVQKDIFWVERNFAKPYVVIWHELRGRSLMPLETSRKISFDSISKTRTFRPPTNNPAVLFAQLSKNIEGACRKARRYNLATDTAWIFIKTQQFEYHTLPLHIVESTNVPPLFIKDARQKLVRMYKSGVMYRATGVTLTKLKPHNVQHTLFEKSRFDTNIHDVFRTVDKLSERYGPDVVYVSSSKIATPKRHSRSIDSANPETFLIPVISSLSRRIYVPFQGLI